MTTDPFESAKALLSWARDDTEAAFAELDRFFQAHTVRNDLDAQTGEQVVTVVIGPLPASVRKLVAHALADLRHALDQALFACVSRVAGGAHEKLQFPMATSPTDAEGQLKAKGVPPQIIAAVARFHPYPASEQHPDGDNLLRKLGTITGPSKHRSTVVLEANSGALGVRLLRGAMDINWRLSKKWDAEKGVMEIARHPPGMDLQFAFNLPVYAALTSIPGEHVVIVLRQMAEKVGAVIGALEGVR